MFGGYSSPFLFLTSRVKLVIHICRAWVSISSKGGIFAFVTLRLYLDREFPQSYTVGCIISSPFGTNSLRAFTISSSVFAAAKQFVGGSAACGFVRFHCGF